MNKNILFCLYFIIPIVYLLLHTILIFLDLSSTKRRIFFIISVLILWILPVPFYLTSKDSFGYVVLVEVAPFLLVFSLCSIFNFITVKKRKIYIILLLPILLIGLFFTAILNEPVYDGGMAGFADIVRLFVIYPLIGFWPLFIFALKQTAISDKIKGIGLVISSFVAGIFGLSLPYGKDGWFADHPTAVFFVVVILLIFILGGCLIWKDKRIKEKDEQH